MSYFKQGDKTVLTYDRLEPKRVELVLPVTVVEDTPEHTMVYVCADTPIQARMMANGSPLPRDIPYRELVKLERVLSDTTWVNTNVLFIWRPQWHWDVRLYWREKSHEFIGWYINIQDPMRRTADGFFTTDHLLDVTVEPDRTWTFKDEAELADAVDIEMYTSEQSELVHQWAHDAIELLESSQWPFNIDPTQFEPFGDSSLATADS